MNPQSNCTTPTNKQTKALRQAQTNTVMRTLEQSSDTVQRRTARTDQAVQELEQSSNTVRRCSARTNQAVREINLKSDVVLASSKAKGDHLNNDGQEETASKNDSEDLYKDSFLKSDDSWDTLLY